MDYHSDRGYDDSDHRTVQDEQQPPSDYEVETSAERRNGDAADDTGGVQMKHSVEHSHASSSMSSPMQLFVGGISWKTTEETIANYFGNFGNVVDAVIKKDRMTGTPRGFGFVTFANSAVAEKVLEKEHVIDDQKVDVERRVHRRNRDTDIEAVPDTRRIFVGGLPLLLEEDELKNYFSVYGVIIKYHIVYDHHIGRSRGFGFITFKTEDSVDRIFSGGKVHKLWGKQVNIKRAEPKSRGRDNSFRSNVASGKYDQEDRYGGKLHECYSGGYGGNGAYVGNSMVNAAGFSGDSSSRRGRGNGTNGSAPARYNMHLGSSGYGGNGAYAGNSTVNAAGFYGDSGSRKGRGDGANGSGPARYHT